MANMSNTDPKTALKVLMTPKNMSQDMSQAQNISDGISRRASNMDPSNNDAIVSTTHRDPEPAMDPTDRLSNQ